MSLFFQKMLNRAPEPSPRLSPVWRWPQKLCLLACAILVAAVALYIDQLSRQNHELGHRDAILRELGAISAKLESGIKADMQAAKALVAAVRQHPDLKPKYLDNYSQALLSGESRIRSVAAFDGFIGAYVYPLKGNEAVLGLDLRSRPDQLKDLLTAQQKQLAVLSGPVELVQGGRALIARLPVDLGPAERQAITVSAVIDIDKLLSSSGLAQARDHLNIAIVKRASAQSPRLTVTGDTALFSPRHRAVTTRISLPLNGYWEIAATPQGGWHAPSLFNPLRLVTGALALLIIIFIGVIFWLFKKNQESNQLLEQLFELSPIGIALNDYSSGRFIAANQSLCDSLGYDIEHLTQLSYQQITPPEFALDDQASYLTLSKRGRLGSYQKQVIRADGELVSIENNSILFRDTRGRPLIWSMVEDITERKRAERLIDRQQQMFNAMSQQARIGAWELELPSQCLTWSPITKEICGVSPQFEPSYTTISQALGQAELLTEVGQLIDKAINNGQAFSREIHFTSAAGRQLWIQLTGHPVIENGQCTRIFGSLQDIDDRKRAADALIKARDDAEQAARSKSEFLATMSHEIRTPMNGVLGMLNLLGNSALDFEQERRISIARSSAHSLLSLIDDVLDFSRLDAGKMALENTSFDLRKVIEEVCQSMSLRAQEKGLELIVDLSDIQLDRVCGDAAKLRQILTNLLGNAIKFTEAGEVIVRAELSEQGQRQHFRCIVSDTGIGIAADKLDSLFNAFTQADTSTTRKYGGSGLGLSISQKLCHAMGGNIAVRSIEGQGSDFVIELDFDPAEDGGCDQAYAQDRHIWLIEDNNSARNSLKKQLQKWGARVYCSSSSQNALRAAERGKLPLERIDLIIIDRYMDQLDGTELVQFLRQEALLTKSPMVLLSNISSEGTDSHFRALGFDAWQPKPLCPSSLRELLALQARGGQVDNTATTRQPSVSLAPVKGKRVLLVEDNAVNQEVVRSLLEELGLQVSCAANGKNAIAMLQAQQSKRAPDFSLILMDCQMPEMDGYECTRQIRAGIAGSLPRRLPIVALTANALNGDREKCSAAGMDDYLSKPIDPDRLQAKLLNWLQLESSNGSPAHPEDRRAVSSPN